MVSNHTSGTDRLSNALVDRTVAVVLALFLAFWPFATVAQSVDPEALLGPIVGTYYVLAVEIPALLAYPVTEFLFGGTVFEMSAGIAVVAMGLSYLTLSVAVAGAYRTAQAKLSGS